MPKADGQLTQGEQEKLKRWLETHSGPMANSACPSCGTNNWTLGSHLINALVYHPGGAMVVGGPTYPMAFIACANCFHVRTFMAIPIGITGDAKEPGDG
jgi:hypothetical protein